MFTKELKFAGHIKRFTIREGAEEGWEVREEADSEIVRVQQYRDWHRLECARMRIDQQVDDLEHEGSR